MQNKKLKKIIDLLMLLSLFFLMGYFYFDKSSHMLIGILCFVLFIIHQILNMSWYKTLLKGKYTYPRIIIFIINVLLLLCMLLQMISGFMMSSYISGIHQGMALFRRIYLALCYWCFILVACHIGIHVRGILRKQHFKIFYLVISLYGLYVLIKRNILAYMFFRVEYYFFDTTSIFIFYLDHLAMMILFVGLTDILLKGVRKYESTRLIRKSS